MKSVISISVLILFLIVPFTASAESWVLWTKTEIIDKDLKSGLHWELIDAYEKHENCSQAQMRVWSGEKERFEDPSSKGVEKITAVPPSLLIAKLKAGGMITKNLYCLPGTLDPRK